MQNSEDELFDHGAIYAVLALAQAQAPLSNMQGHGAEGLAAHLCADLECVEPGQLPVNARLCGDTGSRTQVLLTNALPYALVRCVHLRGMSWTELSRC